MLADLLRELLGAATPMPIRDAQKAVKKGGVGAAIGGAGRMNPNNKKVGKAMQMQPKKMMPIKEKLPMLDYAQNQFPGRTNYGVPQDNMIDTSMGYLTNDQFNQGVSGRLQRQSNPMDFDTIPNNFTAGRTGYYQGSNPYLQGGGANQYEELKNRLRVR